MDIDISGWILEFLLRQNTLTDQTLNNLIHVLPLPNNNPRLKKTLILRKLESDIKKHTYSENTLKFLEQIQQLDHLEGVSTPSDVMKAAYSTLAMHCIAKLINNNNNNNINNNNNNDDDDDNNTGGDKKVKYVNVVKRLLSVRVSEMERCGVGLVQDDVVKWVRDVEDGAVDVEVCENVLEMFMEVDVVKSVERYVDEAKEEMGCSFLEEACEAVLRDGGLSRVIGLDDVAEFRHGLNDDGGGGKGNEELRAHEDEVSKLNNQSKDSAPTDDAGANSKGNEASKAHVPPTHKHVVSRRSRRPKIVDPMETSQHKYDFIPSPEVSKVQEALKSSSFDLHAAVKDPLPDALRLAESLKASTSGENEAHELVGGNLTSVNDKAPSSSHDRKGKALEAHGDDDTIKDQNRNSKPSLFERNNTAHTTEWSDSIDSSEEGSPTRPHLPSPQKREVSPLSVYKMEKLARQRKKKRWTPLEEDTLRTGVQKFGKGHWKLILNKYLDIFEDRTEVDLKDKWRNLTRY